MITIAVNKPILNTTSHRNKWPECDSQNEFTIARTADALQKRFQIRCLHWVFKNHQIIHWIRFVWMVMNDQIANQDHGITKNAPIYEQINENINNRCIRTQQKRMRRKQIESYCADDMTQWQTLWTQWTRNSDEAHREPSEKVWYVQFWWVNMSGQNVVTHLYFQWRIKGILRFI